MARAATRLALAAWCALLGAALAHQQRQHIYHNEFAVHVPAGADHADRIAARHGFRNHGQIGSLKEYFLLSHEKVRRRSVTASAAHDARLRAEPHVRWVMQQRERRRVKRDHAPEEAAAPWAAPRHRAYNRALAAQSQAPPYFPDPLFKEQWYLNGGAKDGLDMRVSPAWARGYTGKGVVVSILDDGIQTNHPDLAQNYDPAASTDINGNDEDPTPQDNGDNKHGTRCAGEVAAVAYNQYCGVGVAYNASVGGVRMLDGVVNDAVEARALGLNPDHVDIYSASWGPEDDGKTVDGPGPLARRAFIYGVTSGRRGKGSIFVWASGNGGRHTDSCNCDGYTNSIFTLSISSATQGGYKPWYLEECSSTLASTYSSGTPGHDKSVATADMDGRLRPDRLCTVEHTGTSASAPLAAGICALALEANPELTWRDMQHLVVMTSRAPPLEKETGWIVNGVGRKVSHKFGYGLMDAAEMVAMAERWSAVPPQHICKSQEITEDRAIEATYGYTLAAHTDVTGCRGTVNEVRHLEHVQCKISLRFFPRGNLRILLTSPAGTASTLLFERPRDVVSSNFDDWPFLSVHFWGERADGRWTLQVVNAGNRHVNQPGVLKKWQLIFYGTSAEPVRLRERPGAAAPPPFAFPTAGDTFEQPAGDAFYNSDAYANFQNYPLFAAGSDPEKAVAAPDGSPPPVSSPPPTVDGRARTVLRLGCDPECDESGCYGAGPARCVGCRHRRLEESCVPRCPPRGYAAPSGRCLPCDASCATCAGAGRDACLACAPAHLLLADLGLCLQRCPDGYYEREEDAAPPECRPCPAHCASCDSSGACTACDHHLLLHGGACLAACPPATYETADERCAPCDAACDTCVGAGAARCALCRPGRYAHRAECLPACPPRHYPDKKRRECMPCEAGCAACSSGACAACDAGWTLGRKGRCAPDDSGRCRPAEFFSSAGAGRCERCSPACGACSGPAADECLACAPPLLLLQTRCVEVCEAGHYAEGGRCARCPAACAACASRLNCTACAGARLRLQGGACVAACARGYYADRAACGACHLACETCAGPRRDQCVTCPPGWRLAAGECRASCPDGFFDSDELGRGCLKCHRSCRTCHGAGPLQCASCPPPRAPSGGACAECASGRYYDAASGACRSCHAACRACAGPSRRDCLECAPPLRLDRVNNACVPCCPAPGSDGGGEGGGGGAGAPAPAPAPAPDVDPPPECCRCDHSGECRHSSAAGKRRVAEAEPYRARAGAGAGGRAGGAAGPGAWPGAWPLALALAGGASVGLLLLLAALQRAPAGGGRGGRGGRGWRRGGAAYSRLPSADAEPPAGGGGGGGEGGAGGAAVPEARA